jgi:hypothetical protein
MRRLSQLAMLLVLLVAAPLYGQVEVTATKMKAYVGSASARPPQVIGNTILVGPEVELKPQEVAVVTVSSPAPFVLTTVRKDLFTKIEPKKLREYKRDDEPGKPDWAYTDWIIDQPGKYLFEATAFDPTKGLSKDDVVVEVGGTIPPTPEPKPDPDPKPEPDPKPDPNPPAPIPAPGLHVLMTYQNISKDGASALDKLSEAQKAVLFGQQVRAYLWANAAIGKDGKHSSWRILDVDTDMSRDEAKWRAAMARPRSSDFWIVISNGTTGYEGPLPVDPDKALELIKKYEVK